MKSSDYLNIVFRYTIALIIVMMLKVGVFDLLERYNLRSPGINFHYNKNLKYEETVIAMNEGEFTKPTFDNEALNKFVDDYIEQNSCSDLAYNIYELGNNRVNLYVNCGTPKNIIYDYKNKKELSFQELSLNYEEFINKVKTLSNLKYPTFVTEDIDFESGIYNIHNNEIISFYKTKEYGDISIKINNNEIKDCMNYIMDYDDAYENEKFTFDKNKKSIAFSFDDGPADYDNELIDLLENAHATATFFVVGNRLSNFPKTVEKLAASNMEVGNHTYDHKSLARLKSDELKAEITKTNDLFYSMTNKELKLLRPSYGAVSKKVLLEVGVPVILWNIDTEDWKYRNAEKVTNKIVENAKDGDIVLMHSLYKTTVEAVEKSLKELYKQGFQVMSISEMAKLKGQQLIAGKSYLALK